jgi:uncharacterized protein
VDHERAASFIEALHRAQAELYSGGSEEGVRSLLTPDVVWHVPGTSPIAGRYQGVEDVVTYMRRRRDLADRTFRMHLREILVGEGEVFAALTDGTAVIDGQAREWSTIGLYRLRDDRLAECRLIPFDAAGFDAIWASSSS